MAIGETVIFEGRNWPGAYRPMSDGYGAFGLKASGKGRLWSTDRPLAFWRNFSALDPTDDEAAPLVQGFVARHGDPDGELDRRAAAGKSITGNTLAWPPLILALNSVAAAWDAPDLSGVSRMTSDRDRLAAADKSLRRLLPSDPDGDRDISQEIEIAYAAQGLTLRPQSLRAFMVLSAAYARERGIAMRRCAYCDDWFELRRSDAFYCSGSCQATHHKRRASLQQQLATDGIGN